MLHQLRKFNNMKIRHYSVQMPQMAEGGDNPRAKEWFKTDVIIDKSIAMKELSLFWYITAWITFRLVWRCGQVNSSRL